MSRQLKYDQVRLAILKIIAKDQLQPGDRLPSVRQLLTRIPCSMITLRKALEMLENEEMLTRSIGKGTFIKQTVVAKGKNGKILFINVNMEGKTTYPPASGWEDMQSYFNNLGFDFQYLHVDCFSDEILKSLDNVIGIMLYGWLTKDFLHSIKALQIPMLIVGNSQRFPGIAQIELDIQTSAQIITEQLIQKGAKSLFLLNSSKEFFMHNTILSGVKKVIKKYDNITFDTVDLIGEDKPKKLASLIEKYGNYDGWIIELGNYFTYLGTTRFYSLKQHPLIGIVGDSGHAEVLYKYLVIGSDNTIVTVFKDSIFKVACKTLEDQIINNIPMKSIMLKPVIENQTLKETL